ncbi:nuclear transport factor 2 family protein [Paraburkholderia sp. Ac-20347]|uniref:nuclear transport factor 2 family protein n=1 Tax=Paraburkholderia sp. Ac-20347 TaxID=2703892 RepID=UPI00197EDE21|nr:nuclear transport factor 2 family protein [Paraburkholderia sp. Ac-20347]MBN3809962.1 nuclear transport factor 2 family protein [Paraburkholderia sp. Ac-20347]
MVTNTDSAILHIYEQWHTTIANKNLEGLMALYAEDAILETPLIVVTLPHKGDGILLGKPAIREFFDAGPRKLQNSLGRWYRTGTFFSNGQQLIWEYPRETPEGDQVDLVEEMDVKDGLISHHRVYWGWVGFKSLVAAANAIPSVGAGAGTDAD